MLDFITSTCNPFSAGNNLRNIVTGIEISENLIEYLKVGEKVYQEQEESYVVRHDEKLHNTIKESNIEKSLPI